MNAVLPIGDFSRATHLSVKMLRHYVVAWYRGAMGEVAATLSAQDISPAGPPGGVFDTELFTQDRGRVTIFLPCDPLPQPVGRVSTTVIPPAELATIVHLGSSTEVDRTYGALAAYVTQQERYSKPHVIEKKKSARAASNASW